MAFIATRSDILNRKKNGGFDGSSSKDSYIVLKVDPSNPEVTVECRGVGFPKPHIEHEPKMRGEVYDEKTKKMKFAWIDTPFVDAAEFKPNQNYSRICSEGNPKYGPCAWCALGYKTTTKYDWNVIVRGEDGDEVKILNKGASVFDAVFAQEADLVRQNKEFVNKQTAKGKEVTADELEPELLGGASAYPVRITATYDSTLLGKVKYTATLGRKLDVLSDDDIALLEAVGKPTAADLEAIYASQEAEAIAEHDPEDPNPPTILRNFPEYFLSGFPFWKMRKYVGIKGESEAATTTDQFDIDAPSPSPAAPSKAATPAPATASAEPESDPSDDVWDVEPQKIPATTATPAPAKPASAFAPAKSKTTEF